ncbi:hypothetical protein DKT69_34560 [Micromonospora sicca]|uniref:Uncharacterized protein n=1 Tax=Micromonospora sicca TaxID=2202420 RepID=A0A317CZF7_9ACTN|nr:hypothetical protein DKT69_34560 [Micromonospora sp. 4G51]
MALLQLVADKLADLATGKATTCGSARARSIRRRSSAGESATRSTTVTPAGLLSARSQRIVMCQRVRHSTQSRLLEHLFTCGSAEPRSR